MTITFYFSVALLWWLPITGAWVSIEYSAPNRLRSFWYAQELLTTFADRLDAVSLVTSNDTPLRVSFQGMVVWETDDFPEPKELKQVVRDLLDPSMDLGHSDNREPAVVKTTNQVLDLSSEVPEVVDAVVYMKSISTDATEPNVSILYCTGCRWLLRAAYLGQELLDACSEIRSLTLVPSRKPCRPGSFVIQCSSSEQILWNRAEAGGFPTTQQAIDLVREALRTALAGTEDPVESEGEAFDDDEAEEARRYFGVM